MHRRALFYSKQKGLNPIFGWLAGSSWITCNAITRKAIRVKPCRQQWMRLDESVPRPFFYLDEEWGKLIAMRLSSLTDCSIIEWAKK